MTGDELIAEAKRRYPLGTKIISADNETDRETIVGGENVYTHYENNTSNVDAGYLQGYIHYAGKWAKILELPEGHIVDNNQDNYILI